MLTPRLTASGYCFRPFACWREIPLIMNSIFHLSDADKDDYSQNCVGGRGEWLALGGLAGAQQGSQILFLPTVT